MPLRKFHVQYKEAGSKVWLRVEEYIAKNEADAIRQARESFVEGWNLSFPWNPDGEKQVEKMEFAVYK